MMKEAECQTNPVLEEGILQEILDNTEIFQFIVTKQPSIIHKFYMMTKYARWFSIFVHISCDVVCFLQFPCILDFIHFEV